MEGRAMAFRLIEATVDSIREALAEGEITSRQLAQLYIDRINAYDRIGPSLTSVQNLNPAALSEADRLDAERRSGQVRGPLHGVPVLVKDQLETSDMPTTYG
jgi:amidase